MTGWRLGYIGPTNNAKYINKMQGQTTSANCSIAQRAGLAALKGGNECAVEMKMNIQKRETVYNIPVELINLNQQTKGAFYFSEISNYLGNKTTEGKVINSASELSLYLLENARYH